MPDYSRIIAGKALEINAIKLNPEHPFQWASGYMMPIYNDNRRFLFYPGCRKIIADGLDDIISKNKIECDIIAGTSTAGIPPATILADKLCLPLVYVRGEAKDHGLRNIIECLGKDDDIYSKKTPLIEDLVSTGSSSAKAVQALRDRGALANDCISIFNYGFDEAQRMFDNIKPPCSVNSILYYDTLLECAVEANYIDEEQFEVLSEWRKAPFTWGEDHGFPRKVA